MHLLGIFEESCRGESNLAKIFFHHMFILVTCERVVSKYNDILRKKSYMLKINMVQSEYRNFILSRTILTVCQNAQIFFKK